jgi:hypothetical protein
LSFGQVFLRRDRYQLHNSLLKPSFLNSKLFLATMSHTKFIFISPI